MLLIRCVNDEFIPRAYESIKTIVDIITTLNWSSVEQSMIGECN